MRHQTLTSWHVVFLLMPDTHFCWPKIQNGISTPVDIINTNCSPCHNLFISLPPTSLFLLAIVTFHCVLDQFFSSRRLWPGFCIRLPRVWHRQSAAQALVSSPLLTGSGRQRGSSLFSCHSQLQFHPLWSSLRCQVLRSDSNSAWNIRIIRWGQLNQWHWEPLD